MTILTKAAAPVKGTATLFTLDKAALAAVTSVAADVYYSDSANWKSVSLMYHSSVGDQHEIIKFDATLSSPTSKFLVSVQARDVFEIRKIIIKDFDGGTFEVLRSELITADFDVDMSAVAPAFVAGTTEHLCHNFVTTAGSFNISGNISNGSFANDVGNYAYTFAGAAVRFYNGNSSTATKNLSIGIGGFSALGADLMEHTPTQIKVYHSEDEDTYTLHSTHNFVRGDFVVGTRKDLLFAPIVKRYWKIELVSVDSTHGSSCVFTEITSFA